jgi:hypothetical protein
MIEAQFEQFNDRKLIELIESVQNEIFLSVPGIHEEIASALLRLKGQLEERGRFETIHLLLDFEPEMFRQGYGTFSSMEKLFSEVKVWSIPNNRISFIIADDQGYFIFQESRYLKASDAMLINGYRMDADTMDVLKKSFFPNSPRLLIDILMEEETTLPEVREVTFEKIQEIRKNLESNPPIEPDFKRIIDIYSNKFQYVRLNFKGANLENKKVSLPQDALPIDDDNLRNQLQTSISIFNQETNFPSGQNKGNQNDILFKPLNELKKEIENIREEFLVKLKSRDESVLSIASKKDFKERIETLEQNLNLKKQDIELLATDKIKITKNNFNKVLFDYYKKNPDKLFSEREPVNQGLVESRAEDKINEVNRRVNWPSSKELIDNFKLTVHYSDITIEDLKDKGFRAEIEKLGIISTSQIEELTKLTKGLPVK